MNLRLPWSRYHISDTPLVCACRHGRKEIVNLLLDCPEIDIELSIPSESSNLGRRWPLQEACYHAGDDDYGVVSLPIDRGARIHATILHAIRVGCWLGQSAENQELFPLRALVKRLISLGVSVDALESSGNRTPLATNILRDHPGSMKLACLLLEPGTDSEARTVKGLAPASIAAKTAYNQSLETLLSREVDAQATDNRVLTVLMHALAPKDAIRTELMILMPAFSTKMPRFKHRRFRIKSSVIAENTRALLNNGTDPFVVDYAGFTARSRWCRYFRRYFLFSSVESSHHNDQSEALGEIWQRFGAILALLPPGREDHNIPNMIQWLDKMVRWNWGEQETVLMAKERLNGMVDHCSWDERFREWQIMARKNGWKAEPD